MHISILTLFPPLFTGVFEHSIIKRAQEKKLVTINYINIRDFAEGKYKTVDDKPYGGGAGMILKVDVVDRAIISSKAQVTSNKTKVVLLTPQGQTYSQSIAKKLSTIDHLILIAGHYEGFDERIRNLVDMELSIGDYILTGGEIPAMVIVDSVVRLLPKVFTKEGITDNESFGTAHILEYPQYTKPLVYKGKNVPDILLSGNHAEIKQWKKEQAHKRTKERRPDLLP